jgi:hypothetical protein
MRNWTQVVGGEHQSGKVGHPRAAADKPGPGGSVQVDDERFDAAGRFPHENIGRFEIPMCKTACVERADKTPETFGRCAQDGLFLSSLESGRVAKKNIDGNGPLDPFRGEITWTEEGAPTREHGQ